MLSASLCEEPLLEAFRRQEQLPGGLNYVFKDGEAFLTVRVILADSRMALRRLTPSSHSRLGLGQKFFPSAGARAPVKKGRAALRRD